MCLYILFATLDKLIKINRLILANGHMKILKSLLKVYVIDHYGIANKHRNLKFYN